MGGACGKWWVVMALAACGGGGGGGAVDAADRVDARHRPDSAAPDARIDAPDLATDVFEVATGTGAPLSGAIPEGSGSDLDFRAHVGGVTLVNDDDSRVWLCFAPDLPDFPTY